MRWGGGWWGCGGVVGRALIGGVTGARHVGSPFHGRHGYADIRGEVDVSIRFLQRRTASRARNILSDEDATFDH